MNKTLEDYIKFLRDNGFVHEAIYYENEVVDLLKQFGCENPLSLTTDQVPAKLYAIETALTVELDNIHEAAGQNKMWDVELDGSTR